MPDGNHGKNEIDKQTSEQSSLKLKHNRSCEQKKKKIPAVNINMSCQNEDSKEEKKILRLFCYLFKITGNRSVLKMKLNNMNSKKKLKGPSKIWRSVIELSFMYLDAETEREKESLFVQSTANIVVHHFTQNHRTAAAINISVRLHRNQWFVSNQWCS